MEPEISIGDALEHYGAIMDLTHKYWAYYQLLAAASVAAAWSDAAEMNSTLPLLIAPAFAVFGAINGYLIIDAQAAASLVRTAVVAQAKAMHGPFSIIVGRTLRPANVIIVATWHFMLSIATIFGILMPAYHESPEHALVSGGYAVLPPLILLFVALMKQKEVRETVLGP